MNTLDEIIQQLTLNGFGNNNLNNDPLLESIKIALEDFKNQLLKTNEENIINILRNIFLPSLDIIKTFPMNLVAVIDYKKNFVLKKNDQLFLDYNTNNVSTWTVPKESYFYNINITTNYDSNEGLWVHLESPDPITATILNNLNFYWKDGDNWWFNYLDQPIEIFKDNIKIAQGTIVINPLIDNWSSVKNGNIWMDFLLENLWNNQLNKFFQIKVEPFIPSYKISLNFPWSNINNFKGSLHINYINLINYFYGESLPIIINSNDDIYAIRNINNNDLINTIDEVTIDGEKINTIDENDKIFFTQRWVNGQICIQLSETLKNTYKDKKLLVKGWFKNHQEPKNNPLTYLNNDGSINNIIVLQLSHQNFNNINFNEQFIGIFKNYLNLYNHNYNENYIKNMWINLKQFSNLMGNINSQELFNGDIIDNKYSMREKIVFFNGRNQIIDVHCWEITISNKKYINFLNYFFNKILNEFSNNCWIIIG